MTAFNERAPKCAFYRLSSHYWLNATSSSFIIICFGFCFKAFHNYGLFFDKVNATNRNQLIRMIHHGYQKIQQNHYIDNRICAKH